jgi:hypothetical protein
LKECNHFFLLTWAVILTRYAGEGKPPLIDLPSSEGAKDKLGIADLKEGDHAAEAAFG